MFLEKLKDYIPKSSKPGKPGPSAKKEEPDVAEEELREDLNLTAEPEGTTSFNRKNVMIGLGVVGVIFTIAFIYGISTASTTNKHRAEADKIETADQATHLKDAPKGYDDDKTRQYDKSSSKRGSDKDKEQERVSRLHDDGSVEYETRTPRRVPAYTPIPQSSYRPQAMTPVPRVSAPVASGAAARGNGLTPQQKMEAEKAKEKMAANQSPIGFKLDEAKGVKE